MSARTAAALVALLFVLVVAGVIAAGSADLDHRQVVVTPDLCDTRSIECTSFTPSSARATTSTVPGLLECVTPDGYPVRTDEVSARRRHLACNPPYSAGISEGAQP